MKAIDPCERWKMQHGELIIERLLAISERSLGLSMTPPSPRGKRDRYYTAARRVRVRELMKARM